MRTRSISAIGIFLVSIVPSMLGGWIFALTVAIVFSLAYREMLNLLGTRDRISKWYGFGIIAFASAAAVLWPVSKGLPLVVTLLCLIPLAIVILPTDEPINRTDWAVRLGGAAYLVFPAYGAVSLRETVGTVDAAWLQNAVEKMPFGGNTAVGLGWFLFALFITWMSDTFAYLVGKSVGKTKLIPRVSPNKTVEGAIGGFAAGGITAVLIVLILGLPMHPIAAAVLGVALGAIGLLGDLFESQLKRRAGVKDSGDAIPGHGGFLDRIDALIWVLLVTFALVPFLT